MGRLLTNVIILQRLQTLGFSSVSKSRSLSHSIHFSFWLLFFFYPDVWDFSLCRNTWVWPEKGWLGVGSKLVIPLTYKTQLNHTVRAWRKMDIGEKKLWCSKKPDISEWGMKITPGWEYISLVKVPVPHAVTLIPKHSLYQNMVGQVDRFAHLKGIPPMAFNRQERAPYHWAPALYKWLEWGTGDYRWGMRTKT